MHRNIIVQHRRINPNYERIDLSINDEPVKPPITKNAISVSCGIPF
jgi:hypothetical protein